MDEVKNMLLEHLEGFNEHFHQRLWSYFMAANVSSVEAEDLCSEVYLGAFLKIENNSLHLENNSFEDFCKYLWGIARNMKKVYFRSKAQHKVIAIDAVIEPEAKVSHTDIDVDLIHFHEGLEDAIAKLSDSQRTIATLYFLSDEKMTRRDIAVVLGLNPDSVSKTIFRVKATLRESLKDFKDTYVEWINQA